MNSMNVLYSSPHYYVAEYPGQDGYELINLHQGTGTFLRGDIASAFRRTLAVAKFLKDHPLVTWVNYPGLPDNKYYGLVKKYLPKGASGILTFGIKGGEQAGIKFIEAVQFLSHLANVGDAKTLVIHPASTTHRQLSEEEQIHAGVTPDMVRISVGLEEIDDILWDIDQALQKSR